MPRPSANRRAADTRGSLLDLGALAAAVALFAANALFRLDLPGLHQDEAFMVTPALRFLQGRGGGAYTLLPGGLDLPLMVSDHVGPVSTYLIMPWLAAFGPGMSLVRLYQFAVGLFSLVLIFLWARRVLAPGAAGVTVLLLSVSPSLWLAARNGLYLQFIMVPIAAASLLSLDCWYRTRRTAWLCAGTFLLGLGFTAKILFLWFLLALLIGVAIAKRDLLRRLTGRPLLFAAAAFACGAAPLLLFNLFSRGLTARTIIAHLTTTPYGVRNTAFLTNLGTQANSFGSLLDGGWLTWTGASPHNPIAPWLFALAAAYHLWRWRVPGANRVRFCLIALAVLLLASCFTITTLGPKHLIVMLPFPHLLIAAALGSALRDRGRLASRILAPLLALLCVASFAFDLRSDFRYRRALAATAGVGLFSSAHNAVADYLAHRDIARPLAADWGFADTVELLTAGGVIPRQIAELSEPPPYPFTRAHAGETLADPSSRYLFHAEPWAAAPGRYGAVEDVAAEMGLRLELIEAFPDGIGRPVVLLYRPSRAEH